MIPPVILSRSILLSIKAMV